MRKKSDARIAAATATAVAAVTAAAGANIGAPALRKVISEEDDIISEVLLEVKNISLYFTGLLQDKIVWIFYNKFKAINLYHLQHMRGLRYEAF